jgi:hypothetical protein
MKTTETKICNVCGNGYKEVICSNCGSKMFYFLMGSDVLVKGIFDDNGVFSAVFAVGPHMDVDSTTWKCCRCDTEVEIEVDSFGYSWTDLYGIEKETMEEVFHKN